MFWIVITIIIIIIIALCVGVSVRLYLRKRKRKEAAMEMVEYRAVSDVIKVQIDQYIWCSSVEDEILYYKSNYNQSE